MHTVFLREAYKKGELVEPNDLYLARRKLADLVLLSPRKVKMDQELVNYRRDGEEDNRRMFKFEDDFEARENGKQDEGILEDTYGDDDHEDVSDYSDEDNECNESESENARLTE